MRGSSGLLTLYFSLFWTMSLSSYRVSTVCLEREVNTIRVIKSVRNEGRLWGNTLHPRESLVFRKHEWYSSPIHRKERESWPMGELVIRMWLKR